MKHTLAICLAAAALGTLLSVPGSAEPARVRLAQAVGADVRPPYEIAAAARSLGLNPLGRPARQGSYYVFHALDPRGVEMRVVADAHFGEIVSVAPARTSANYYPPRYDSGPRIITVPQNDTRPAYEEDPVPRNYRRGVREYDRAPQVNERVPPSYQRPPPGYDRRASAPPPPPPSRAVVSPPAYRPSGPTPIKPLPRPRAADQFLPPPEGEPEPRASADEPAPQSTASVPSRMPRSITLAPPPPPAPESAPPQPNQLMQFPPVAPLE